MKHQDDNAVEINPDKETAERNRLQMMPGDLEDIETASARETRVNRQQDAADGATNRDERPAQHG